MAERIVLLALVCAAGYLAYRGLCRWQIMRPLRRATPDPLLADLSLNRPAIVYFTTPTCQVCKFRQAPVLERLQRADAVQIIQVDATEQPEVAGRWGVLSAPTTFILDAQGQPRAVNNGFADERTLRRQLGLPLAS